MIPDTMVVRKRRRESPRRFETPPMSHSDSLPDDDKQLMAAIAQRRDRVAFSNLMGRHQKALFNLAHYLTKGRENAAEAMQEAMLAVWTNASQFEYRGPGSVRAWLTRLTAHASIRLVRRVGGEARRIAKKKEERVAVREGLSPESNVEQHELRGALRARLDDLSAVERQLVGLYFGADMDQQSIAQHLKLSQQAVSYKLKRILETLRAGLSHGGFAAAMPLLETPDLDGILFEGMEVPRGLAENILDSLSHQAGQGSPPSGQGATANVTAYLVAVFAAGIAVAGWWMRPPVASPEAPSSATISGKAPPAIGPQKTTRDETQAPLFHRRWDFNTAEQLGSAFLNTDSIEFVPKGGSQRSGFVRTTKPRVELLFRDVPLDRLPLRIRLKGTCVKLAPGKREGLLSPGWSVGSLDIIGHFRNAGVIISGRKWKQYECYLSRHFNDVWVDGARTNIMYVSLRERRVAGFAVDGFHVFDDLEIDQVSERDLPDVAPFLAAVESIPLAGRRSGSYEMPGLPSMRAGKKVILRFDSLPPLQPAIRSDKSAP